MEYNKKTVYKKVYHLKSDETDLSVNAPGAYMIGRDLSCDFVLSDSKISRKHCRLEAGDSLTVFDLNSTNGSFLNQERIGEQGCVIEDGDTLQIGDLEFRISAEQVPVQNEKKPDFFERIGVFNKFIDRTHCSKCKKEYKRESDKYCRSCGTERKPYLSVQFEKRDFEESMNIYGPPPVTVHYRCSACGNTWQGSNWSMDRYCPNCGNECENDLPEGEFKLYG